jgi:hypothetical protein
LIVGEPHDNLDQFDGAIRVQICDADLGKEASPLRGAPQH